MNNHDSYENMLTPDMIDISLDDFDNITDEHEFSTKYKTAKKEMLRNYRKRKLASKRRGFVKAAVIACVIIIGIPIIVDAATNGELFERIWGNKGKKNIKSYQKTVYSEDKGTSSTVTYPQVEYEKVDPKKAEELIGENISYQPIEYLFTDGTKITFLSSVSDGNSAVVEFTLEKEGGVDCLNYSQMDNLAKGAWFNEDSCICFNFYDCAEKIYVDIDKSTDEKLYCYDYIVLENRNIDIKELRFEATNYPCSRSEYNEIDIKADETGDEELKAKSHELYTQIKYDLVSIPLKEKVAQTEFICENGASTFISPLSIDIDMINGLGLSEEAYGDPYYVYYVAIKYKDGSEYIVCESLCGDIHDCEVETNNKAYACGMLDEHFIILFNRLVDVDKIDYIQIDELRYDLK